MAGGFADVNPLEAVRLFEEMGDKRYERAKDVSANRNAWLDQQAQAAQSASGQLKMMVDAEVEREASGDQYESLSPEERAQRVAALAPEQIRSIKNRIVAQNEDVISGTLGDLVRNNPFIRAEWERLTGGNFRHFEGIEGHDVTRVVDGKSTGEHKRIYGVKVRNDRTKSTGPLDDSPEGQRSAGNPNIKHVSFDGAELIDNMLRMGQVAVMQRGGLSADTAAQFDASAVDASNQALAEKEAIGLAGNAAEAQAMASNFAESSKHITRTLGGAGVSGGVPVAAPTASASSAVAGTPLPGKPIPTRVAGTPLPGKPIPTRVGSATRPTGFNGEPAPTGRAPGELANGSAVNPNAPGVPPSAVPGAPTVVPQANVYKQAAENIAATAGGVKTNYDVRVDKADLARGREQAKVEARKIAETGEVSDLSIQWLATGAGSRNGRAHKATQLTPGEMREAGLNAPTIELVIRRRIELEDKAGGSPPVGAPSRGPTRSETKGQEVGAQIPPTAGAAVAAYKNGEASVGAVVAALPRVIVDNKNFSAKNLKVFLDNADTQQFAAERKAKLSPRMQWMKGLADAAGWTDQAAALTASRSAGNAALVAGAADSRANLDQSATSAPVQVDNSTMNQQLGDAAAMQRERFSQDRADARARISAVADAKRNNDYTTNVGGAAERLYPEDKNMQSKLFGVVTGAVGVLQRMGLSPDQYQLDAAVSVHTADALIKEHNRTSDRGYGRGPTEIDNIVPMLVKKAMPPERLREYEWFKGQVEARTGRMDDGKAMDMYTQWLATGAQQ